MCGNMDFDELVIEYLSGSLRGERVRTFLDMIDADERYARRFDELNRLYACSLMPHFEAARGRNWNLLHRRMKRASVKKFPVLGWLYVAAALLIGVVSGIGFSIWSNEDAQDQMLCEVVVPEGSRTSLTLPDSSTVWLNSGSRLSYTKDFGRKNRNISLCGEGFFDVRRDESHPFVVSMDALKVKVLGTVFNVCAEKNRDVVFVDLVKGKVEVMSENGDSLVLAPGQRAVLDRSTGKLAKSQSGPFVSDWVNGRMAFVNSPVTDILERLQKHFGVKIEVHDARLSEERFTGSIDLGLPLDEILDYLDVDEKYSVTMNGGVVYIASGSRNGY